MAKGLRKGSFPSKMYKKGLRRGKHISKRRVMRVTNGLARSGKKSQAVGSAKAERSIRRSLKKRRR